MASLATDNFNRTDGGLGANWATQTGFTAPLIASNVVQTNAIGSDSVANYSAVTWPNDQYSQVSATTINTATSRFVSATVRCATAAQSFYAAGLAGPFGASTTRELRKCVTGTTTTLASNTGTHATGDVVKCECNGTTIRHLVNGTQIHSVTDSSLASGRAGIFIFVDTGVVADAQLDNWDGGDLTSASSKIQRLTMLGIG